MGLLDQVLSNVLGSSGGSPMQGALMSLLGGGGQQGSISQQQPMGTNPSGAMGGGLGGLVSMFEGAGLGHIIQSWIGGGQKSAGIASAAAISARRRSGAEYVEAGWTGADGFSVAAQSAFAEGR